MMSYGRFFVFVVLAAQPFSGISAYAQPSLQWIRVAIVRSDPQVDLQVHGKFTMRSLHTGDSLKQESRLRKTRIRAVPGGLSFGRELIPFTGVRIEPNRDATISLNGKRLRGTIEIVRNKNLTLLIVNHVDLEDYLRGVLSKEAPDYWPAESLKAIAIVARTYAAYQRLTKSDGDYDVRGDVMSQDYGGKTAEKTRTTRAVQASRGWILVFRGELFPTFYHSTCGGTTEHARVMGSFDIEPLQGGIACNFCSASPFYSWQRRLSSADVAWALRKSSHGRVGDVRDVRISKRTETGRAEQIAIEGSLRTLKLSGYDFRALFGFERIRSLQFSITRAEDAFILRGHGWGHGVGMCQWGAAELARQGLSAAEILMYYYPGSELVNLNELAGQPISVIKGEG